MTIILSKPETAVIWRSTTPGRKATSIPGSDMSNDGDELVVKTTKNNGDMHTITPTFGTIAGGPSIVMADDGGSGHFLSDGKNNDWVDVCICTNTNMTRTGINLLISGAVFISDESVDPDPGPIASSITPHAISGLTHIPTPYNVRAGQNPPFSIQTRLVAYIYSECLPPPTALAAAPTVTSVIDDHGLVWQRRSAFTANLPAAALFRRQNINFETWWADCTSLSDGDDVQVTANFSGPSFVPNIVVRGFYSAGDWDPHPSLPAAIVSTTSNNLPSFVIGTRGTQSLILIYYVTSDSAAFAFIGRALDLFVNPLFTEMFSVNQDFFNLNQDAVDPFAIRQNSAAADAKTASGEGTPPNGAPTFITFPTDPALTWNFYGFGQAVPLRREVITDTSRAHWFICNQPGTTGMFEPIWNTTAPGANTVDGTVTWTYLGTGFFVAPLYTSVPLWTEPWIGGGHWVDAATRCRDSTGTYLFTANFSPQFFGITGLTEPVWNTSSAGAPTVDGTVTWLFVGVYMAPSTQELLVIIDAIDIN